MFYIIEELEVFSSIIKNNKPHIKIKDIKKQMLKKFKISKDYKRHGILKKARKGAHSPTADRKRDISNNMKH